MSSGRPLSEGLDPAPSHAGLASALASPPASAAHSSDRETHFRAFFRANCAYVGRVALSILGTTDELDDLVQDVFIIAHRHLHRLRTPGAVRGWLATITVREARRRLRRRKLRAMLGLERDVAEQTLPPTDANSCDEPRVLAAELERELDRLPVADRIAWTLRIAGHPLPELAQMCGCSLATVKRRISRAQRRLEEVFADG